MIDLSVIMPVVLGFFGLFQPIIAVFLGLAITFIAISELVSLVRGGK